MTTLAPTLSVRYFPRTATWIRDLFLIVFGSLFVAALAQVEIPLPFTPVPITVQTFGVLIIGAALGSKRGALSLALYLAEGIIGLPFFAGGAHGLSVVIWARPGGKLLARLISRSIRCLNNLSAHGPVPFDLLATVRLPYRTAT